jgi:lysophospholipase L1-like esterase
MRILVFGDSNSWGYPPDGSGHRFDEQTRWPCVMAASLRATLIEEALPGRTTRHDDDEMLGAAMNGLTHLNVALKSHAPLDLVVIMLGTNDLKARFNPSAENIADGWRALIACIRKTGGGPGPWESTQPPKIALIAPPPLPAIVDDPDWEGYNDWVGGRMASLGLGDAALQVAQETGVLAYDAGRIVTGASSDPIHLDAESHRALGRAVADWLRDLS